MAAGAHAALALLLTVWPQFSPAREPLHLLFWFAVILLVTEGRLEERALLVIFGPVAATWVGAAVLWMAAAVEGWLAIGLWWRRTRAATAALGNGMHLTVIPIAALNPVTSAAFLTERASVG